MWIPGEENEKGAESVFKAVTVENFPNLWQETDVI